MSSQEEQGRNLYERSYIPSWRRCYALDSGMLMIKILKYAVLLCIMVFATGCLEVERSKLKLRSQDLSIVSYLGGNFQQIGGSDSDDVFWNFRLKSNKHYDAIEIIVNQKGEKKINKYDVSCAGATYNLTNTYTCVAFSVNEDGSLAKTSALIYLTKDLFTKEIWFGIMEFDLGGVDAQNAIRTASKYGIKIADDGTFDFQGNVISLKTLHSFLKEWDILKVTQVNKNILIPIKG